MSFLSLSASKVHDGTASSFVDAMVKLGDNPDIKSVNALLSSFCDLNSQEQDTVMKSPRVYLYINAQTLEQMLKKHSTGTLLQSGVRKSIVRRCVVGKSRH